MEKEIYVHKNPHGKSRLSTKGRIHPDGVKYIRADVVEEQLKQVKNLGLFSVSQQRELLVAFVEHCNETLAGDDMFALEWIDDFLSNQ